MTFNSKLNKNITRSANSLERAIELATMFNSANTTFDLSVNLIGSVDDLSNAKIVATETTRPADYVAADVSQNNTDTSAAIGSIRMNGSATTFNTSSDYRLKENVDYTWDATTTLKQLKPAFPGF